MRDSRRSFMMVISRLICSIMPSFHSFALSRIYTHLSHMSRAGMDLRSSTLLTNHVLLVHRQGCTLLSTTVSFCSHNLTCNCWLVLVWQGTHKNLFMVVIQCICASGDVQWPLKIAARNYGDGVQLQEHRVYATEK